MVLRSLVYILLSCLLFVCGNIGIPSCGHFERRILCQALFPATCSLPVLPNSYLLSSPNPFERNISSNTQIASFTVAVDELLILFVELPCCSPMAATGGYVFCLTSLAFQLSTGFDCHFIRCWETPPT